MAYTFIFRGIGLILSFVTTVLLVNGLGAIQYGQYAFLMSLWNIVVPLSAIGVGYQAMRKIASGKLNFIEKQRVFYSQFTFHLFMATLTCVGLFVLISQFGQLFPIDFSVLNYHSFILIVISVLVATQFSQLFQYDGRVLQFNVLTLAQLAIFFIGVLSLGSLDSLNITSTLNLLGLSYVIAVLLVLPYVYKVIGFAVTAPRTRDLKEDIFLGLPLLTVVFLEQGLVFIERFLISNFVSVVGVAYYALAHTILSLMLFIPKTMCLHTQPEITNAFSMERPGRMRRVVSDALTVYIALVIPLFVFLGSVCEYLLALFIEPDTASHVSELVPLLLSGGFFFGLTMFFNGVFFSTKRTDLTFKILGFGIALHLMVSFYFLAVFQSIKLTALSFSMMHFIVFAITFIKCRSIMNSFDFDFIGAIFSRPIIVLFLIMFFVSSGMVATDPLVMILLCTIGLVLYFTFLIASDEVFKGALLRSFNMGFLKNEN